MTYQSSLPCTVMFYDGACPICSREVAHYQRVDRAKRVDWVDISQDRRLLHELAIPYPVAMERLHVLYRDGRILQGAYAFAAVWSELPGYQHLARLLRFPGMLAGLDVAYGWFARWRSQRQCTEQRCSL